MLTNLQETEDLVTFIEEILNGKRNFLCSTRKEASYKQILKRSANTYESSGSQLFKTATRIQSGLGNFEESRLGMVHFTVFRFTGILCSFRLALEGKTNKKIPESSRLYFSEKISAKNVAVPSTKNITPEL